MLTLLPSVAAKLPVSAAGSVNGSAMPSSTNLVSAAKSTASAGVFSSSFTTCLELDKVSGGWASAVSTVSSVFNNQEPSLTVSTPVKVCTLQMIAESSVVLIPSDPVTVTVFPPGRSNVKR